MKNSTPSFDLALTAVKSVQPGPASPKTRGGRLLMGLLSEEGMSASQIADRTGWAVDTIRYHAKQHRFKMIKSDWYAEDYIRIHELYVRLTDAVAQTLAKSKEV